MKLFTTKEVAKIYSVSDRTVEKWRQRGQGPRYIKLETGQVRYPEAYIAQHLARYRCSKATASQMGVMPWEDSPNG